MNLAKVSHYMVSVHVYMSASMIHVHSIINNYCVTCMLLGACMKILHASVPLCALCMNIKEGIYV